MVDTRRVPAPVFFTVTTRTVLCVPIIWLEKLKEEGDNTTDGCGGAVPEPRRLSDLVATLPLISICADRVPVAEGLNDTEIEQLPLGATGDPQVLVLTKSARCSPVTVIVEICNVPLPVFLTDTVFASLVTPVTVLENDTLVGESVSAGCGGAAPVPFKLITRSATLLLIKSEAKRAPSAVGRNVTEIVQVPFDGSASVQPFVSENSDA
jgi:hypothetical protein